MWVKVSIAALVIALLGGAMYYLEIGRAHV